MSSIVGLAWALTHLKKKEVTKTEVTRVVTHETESDEQNMGTGLNLLAERFAKTGAVTCGLLILIIFGSLGILVLSIIWKIALTHLGF